MQNQYRLGIDAGGTFTDFILADRKGEVRIFKALSTPNDPTAAIRNWLKLIEEETGLTPQTIVANSDLCINGTTVGLNALITHNGAKTGLIATAGHEDSIEIRLGHKEDGYRYDPEYPPATGADIHFAVFVLFRDFYNLHAGAVFFQSAIHHLPCGLGGPPDELSHRSGPGSRAAVRPGW